MSTASFLFDPADLVSRQSEQASSSRVTLTGWGQGDRDRDWLGPSTGDRTEASVQESLGSGNCVCVRFMRLRPAGQEGETSWCADRAGLGWQPVPVKEKMAS